MKKLLFLVLLLGFISISNAQMQFNKLKPISLDTISKRIGHYERKNIKKLHEIPVKIIKGLNFDDLKKELDEKHLLDSTYKPIARAISVNIDIIKDGKWEAITDAARICRMKIKVENSATLILVFDKFYLPHGASLLIYDTEGKMVVGPLTSSSNRQSKKFMTHIIQGPELVFEYCENLNNKDKPEISLSNIGVAFIYDYEQAKNSKSMNNNEMLLYLPPKPYTFCSEFIDNTDIREGTAALCKVKNPNNLLDTIDPDPVGRIITSSCQLLLFYGGINFDSKGAVLLKGRDECTPYIATVAHVVHPESDYEDYSVVRFNWFRKKPDSSDTNPQNNNYSNCYWRKWRDTSIASYAQTIDLTQVIDYNGTTIDRFSPCPCNSDISILHINTRLVHKVWMCGWSAEDTMRNNSPNTYAIALTHFADIPLLYSQGNLSDKGIDFSLYNIDGMLYPWKTKPGYSGTPVFYPQLNGNTIDQYLFIGPLAKGSEIGPQNQITKLHASYVCSSPDSLHAAISSLLCETGNNNYYQSGKLFDPAQYLCPPADTCCNFYYVSNENFANPVPRDANNHCCNVIDIDERLIDELRGDSCPNYILKMNNIDIPSQDVKFNKWDAANLVWKNSQIFDTINFNDFKSKTYRYKVCDSFPVGKTTMAGTYLLKFYKSGDAIPICTKEIPFYCSDLCYCDSNQYTIKLDKHTDNSGNCCYKATIFKRNNSYENNITCSSTFIQVFAANRINQGTDNFAIPYIRLISSYWYDGNGLYNNQYCDTGLAKAVIDNICIENPNENSIVFRFMDGTAFDKNYPNTPYPLYCQQIVNIPPCNCCDGIILQPNIIGCGTGEDNVIQIGQVDPRGCDIDSVKVDAILEGSDGQETILEHLTDYNYNKNHQTLTINKFFAFNSYIKEVSNGVLDSTHSKVKYRLFFKSSDSVFCTKDIDSKECNDCLYEIQKYIRFSFSDSGNCRTFIHIYDDELPGFKKYTTAEIFEYIPGDTVSWNDIGSYDLNSGVQYSGAFEPGIYKIRLGGSSSNCFFYFKLDCWQCKPDQLTAELIRIPNSCCYKIKSNKPTSWVKVYDINRQDSLLCTLSDSSSGTYHYYNYNKACDYLCNDNDKEKMILVKFKLSSTKTCTRILTLPPCTDITTCCKQVKEENVDVIVNPGNDAGETCCFKFNFNDISCNISKINIYKDSGRANYITSIYTKNIDLSNLSDNMGWLCLHNFVHDTLLKIYFALVDSNGTECIHLQPVDIPVCYSCCEHVHATVTSTPDYDDGTKCCFTAEVWADSNKLCPGLAKIEIVRTSDSFSIAKQQIEFNQFDIAYFDFCVGKSVFDSMASLPIIVRCEALDGTILCEYPATIDSCTMPTLCTPDYPLTGWKHNLKPDTLSIGCDTISNCHVVINYSYRLVRDSITNQIKWRDIEVTSFDFDPTCADTNCQNELVEKILAHIWNNKDVTDVFLFNPGGWGNDTIRCFDNLRVISSDCFKSYMPLSDPIDYTSICESTTCCYAIFHTCYKRDAFNNLTNLPDSTKQSEFYKVPVNCPSGCVSGNCGKWNVYGNHASGIIQQTEVIENIFKNNLCNVILKSDNTHTTYSLDLECELNGIIHIELFDLLGNTILSKDVDKTGYKITIPVEILLNSGVYLIRVNIDGTLLFYNKFNIIK